MIGSSRTTFPGSASDVRLGTAHLIEMARAFAGIRDVQQWSPRRGVMFCSWGGSELSHTGLTAYIQVCRMFYSRVRPYKGSRAMVAQEGRYVLFLGRKWAVSHRTDRVYTGMSNVLLTRSPVLGTYSDGHPGEGLCSVPGVVVNCLTLDWRPIYRYVEYFVAPAKQNAALWITLSMVCLSVTICFCWCHMFHIWLVQSTLTIFFHSL